MPVSLAVRSFRRGVMGGSRPWLVVWTVLLAAKVIKRLSRNEPEILMCEELQPGQTFVIRKGERGERP
jgi:hypothetical protein